MRGGVVILLLAITALGAYSIGRQGAPPTGTAPSAVTAVPGITKPLAFVDAPLDAPASKPQPAPSPLPTTAAKPSQPSQAAPQLETKRKVEAALTAAAIAAIIVKASRDQYYATGHPCACPDDLTRNGRACGVRSAYSRPGGASPRCYPSDVTAEMIETYRKSISR